MHLSLGSRTSFFMKGAWFPGNSDNKQTWHGRNMETLILIHLFIIWTQLLLLLVAQGCSRWVFQLHTILVKFTFCSQDCLYSEKEENSHEIPEQMSCKGKQRILHWKYPFQPNITKWRRQVTFQEMFICLAIAEQVKVER